jgi:hypothetical protein
MIRREREMADWKRLRLRAEWLIEGKGNQREVREAIEALLDEYKPDGFRLVTLAGNPVPSDDEDD